MLTVNLIESLNYGIHKIQNWSHFKFAEKCPYPTMKLKAYSKISLLILYRGSQKFQNLNFLHLFAALL